MYLIPKEVMTHYIYRTNGEQEKFWLNIIGILYDHLFPE